MAILINDNTARVQYTATSGQTVFVVPFEFFENADLKVYRNGTLQTITTQYTVTGAGVTGGGNVTFVSGVTLNDVITIVRDIPIKRMTDFPLSGPFNIDALNLQLDQLTAVSQQLETEVVGRVVSLSDSDQPNVLNPVPVLSQRRNGVFYWDENGQPSVIDSTQLATVVAFGNSILDTFTGNGSQTAFTLTSNPVSINNLFVTVNGLAVVPGVAFTWTSTAPLTLTFVSPPAGAAVILVRYFQSMPQGVVADGSVTLAKLGGDITAAGRALLDDANAAAQRTTLGLGSVAILAAPAGTLVGTTDTQTLTNKTFSTGNTIDAGTTLSDTGTITAASPGFRGIPQLTATSARTLALADAGEHISITTGGVVIPANGSVAFPIGTTVVVYNDSASTQTISITTDTLRQAGTANTGTRTLAARGIATLLKIKATEWVATGNLT